MTDEPLPRSEILKDSRPVNKKGKPFTWSYTALSAFENCPASYAAERYFCTTTFKETEALIFGNRVHAACEQDLKGQKVKEPDLLKPVVKYLAAFKKQRDAGAQVEAEVEVTLTQGLQPTGWFDKDAWFRAKLDVVIEKDGKAFYYDYKTGAKVRDSTEQLEVCCAALSIVRPHLEAFTGKLIWTKHETVTGGCELVKDDIPNLWAGILQRVRRMEQAWESENFPAKPSGLCPWCSIVDSCVYARRR
jgi:hypothetical protein